MNITEKIQTLRKEKGWSIARLAKETDMPTVSLRVMLSRDDPNRYTVKNLKKSPKLLMLSALKAAFNVPPTTIAATHQTISPLGSVYFSGLFKQ